ncbi:hypothetical protein TcWFU_000661 [Taenia crassiceps]|uniref:Uncharacterized protein n=1 Tax=Taenia crassiceps TaxID=6207 RepID=A0ABR4QF32_9CEST
MGGRFVRHHEDRRFHVQHPNWHQIKNVASPIGSSFRAIDTPHFSNSKPFHSPPTINATTSPPRQHRSSHTPPPLHFTACRTNSRATPATVFPHAPTKSSNRPSGLPSRCIRGGRTTCQKVNNTSLVAAA